VLYRILFKLILQRISPEVAHRLAATGLRLVTASLRVRVALRRVTLPSDDRLNVRALGMTFPTPLGAGAGLDKNATWFDALGSIGFGSVEVGTITPERQKPNPRPTIFRATADRALLNRMGFPNPGAQKAAARLRKRSGETIVGTNIGKARETPLESAGTDYRATIRAIAGLSDYIVINVSSPNTPGLRDMQATNLLRPLIAEAQEELTALGIVVPVLVKISPDLSNDELDSIADLAVEMNLDGIVAVNSTVDRTSLTGAIDRSKWFEGGGLSGPPLKVRALEVLRRLHARVGARLVLISVGGIETADDAWERILAGASLVQAYTGFIYGGPGWPRHVNRVLAQRVRDAGAASIEDLVGVKSASPDNGTGSNGNDANPSPINGCRPAVLAGAALARHPS